jgi:hypothetical protein
MGNGGLQQRPLTRPQIEHDHHGGHRLSSTPASSTPPSPPKRSPLQPQAPPILLHHRAHHHGVSSPESTHYRGGRLSPPFSRIYGARRPRRGRGCHRHHLIHRCRRRFIGTRRRLIHRPSHFLAFRRCSLLPLLTTRQHVGAASRWGRRESTLICTLKGGERADDAHLLVGAAELGTVAQQRPFSTCVV